MLRNYETSRFGAPLALSWLKSFEFCGFGALVHGLRVSISGFGAPFNGLRVSKFVDLAPPFMAQEFRNLWIWLPNITMGF
jgi:hypothetical protein